MLYSFVDNATDSFVGLRTTWPHVVTACKVFLLIGSWFVLLLNQPLKPVSWWAEVSLECNPKQICTTQWVICVCFWFIGSKQGWFPQKSIEGKCIPFDFSLLLYWIQLSRVIGILCCWCYLFVGIILYRSPTSDGLRVLKHC